MEPQVAYGESDVTETTLARVDKDSDDVNAFCRKHQVSLRRYLRKCKKDVVCHDDLVQEVFCRFFSDPQAFRRESSIQTYLVGILRNVLSENQRQNRKLRLALLACSARSRGTYAAVPTPVELFEGYEVLRSLRSAISALTEEQREAIKLYYMEHMQLSEASRRANCSIEALRSRLRRAHSILRRKLNHVDFDEWQDGLVREIHAFETRHMV